MEKEKKKEDLKRKRILSFFMNKDVKLGLYVFVGFLGSIAIATQLLKLNNFFIILFIGLVGGAFGFYVSEK